MTGSECGELRVACVGTGTIGQSWVIAFARSGASVAIFDVQADAAARAMDRIRVGAADLQSTGIIASAEDLVARIRIASTLEDAVSDVSYVQESVRENVEVKQAVFADIDAAAPPAAILGSSTSEIAGSRFMADLVGRDRALVVHPVNPPYLVPLVELCPTPWTSKVALDRAGALMTAIGQEPILVNREVSGFILNRLQFALVAEALHLVGAGYCSAADIDKTIKHGLGRRWAFMGPMETAHLNSPEGFRSYFQKYSPIIRKIVDDLNINYPWDDQLIDRIHGELEGQTAQDAVPARQAWRDRRLMNLSKHLTSCDLVDAAGTAKG